MKSRERVFCAQVKWDISSSSKVFLRFNKALAMQQITQALVSHQAIQSCGYVSSNLSLNYAKQIKPWLCTKQLKPRFVPNNSKSWLHTKQLKLWSCAMQTKPWSCAMQTKPWSCAKQSKPWSRAKQLKPWSCIKQLKLWSCAKQLKALVMHYAKKSIGLTPSN